MFVDLSLRARHACLLTGFLFVVGLGNFAYSQMGDPDPVHFRVRGPSQRLEMIVNSSRILTLDKEVPRALVNNTEVVRVVPISPNQVQVSALRPGVTQVNLWDETGQVHSVDVVVYGDARELEMLLRAEFPDAALRVRPLASSVLLSGYVDRPEMVGRIVRMAEDYYPKVINNITVGGVQQVALHVKVMEVSRTKLRALGFDWALFDGQDFYFQGISGLISNKPGGDLGDLITTGKETAAFGVIDQGSSFFGVIEALRQNNLVKVLAEPTLVTVSGRPASFNSGGEFPILVPQSLGTLSVEFKEFGTRVDFVPIVLGNGNIRLEVRPQISEVDNARGVSIEGTTVPGLRKRWVDTAAELRVGQTLAVAGLIQSRVESENRGIPWISDLPWAGAAFRRVQETVNEIELLVLVRPELVAGLEPHEVPPCGPGESTTSPNDVELYLRGYLEVPKCCPDGSCGSCQSGAMPIHSTSGPFDPMTVPPGSVTLPMEGSLPEGAAPAYEMVDPSASVPMRSTGRRPQTSARYAPSRQNGSPSAPFRTVAGRPSTTAPYTAGPAATQPTGATSRTGAAANAGLFGPTGYDELSD